MRTRTDTILLSVALALAPVAAMPQDPPATKRQRKEQSEFRSWKITKLFYFGDRCHERAKVYRKNGVATLARTEFQRALDISEGAHTGAAAAVRLMGTDGFWINGVREPSTKEVRQHAKWVEDLNEEHDRLRFGIADRAWNVGLHTDSKRYFDAVLPRSSTAPTFDRKGRLKVEIGGKKLWVPADAAAKFFPDRVEVNGEDRLHTGFLRNLPKMVRSLGEATSDTVSVLSTGGRTQATRLHALADRLLRQLGKRFGHTAPQLTVLAFHERAALTAYVELAGLRLGAGRSLVMPKSGVLATHAEDPIDEISQREIVRQLTYLFADAAGRGWPGWYVEAVSGAAAATFAWDGNELVLPDAPDLAQLRRLCKPDLFIPLDRLLQIDGRSFGPGASAQASDHAVQSWAFWKFLLEAADADVQRRAREWQSMAQGAEPGHMNAQREFTSQFGPSIAELEKGFREWLKSWLER